MGNIEQCATSDGWVRGRGVPHAEHGLLQGGVSCPFPPTMLRLWGFDARRDPDASQDPIGKYRTSKGEALPEGFDHAAWRSKHFNFANENVPKWTEAVKAKYGNDKTKYACTGYCFGAPFVMDLLAGDTVSAGAFAHPTALKEEHFARLKRTSAPVHDM